MFRKYMVNVSTGALLVGTLLGCSASEEAVAQQTEEPTLDMEAVELFSEEGMENSKVMEYASWLTDVYGPRLTNSAQMRRANDYTLEVLEEMGLENAHLHEWGPFGRGWELDRFALHAHSEYSYFPVTAYPKAWSPGYDEPVKGEVIYLSPEMDYREYEGQLDNKFVMVEQPEDPEFHWDPLAIRFDDSQLLNMANAGPDRMAEEGEGTSGGSSQANDQYEFMQFLHDEEPLAVLDQSYRGRFGQIAITSAQLPADPDLGWRERPRPHEADAPDPVPQLSLTRDQYGRLFRMLEKEVEVELEMELETRYNTDDLMGYNTIAEIPGTDPDVGDEVVMIGAHLDSWHSGTGATDNAAGSSVMMEVMRILSETGVEPKRTIRIALWDGEEQGLHGSVHYVQDHFAEPVDGEIWDFEEIERKDGYDKLSAYYNFDNGTGQIRGINLQENEALRDYFRTWFQPFHDWDAATVSYRSTGSTDHVPFDTMGLPGFQFIQDPIEYWSKTHHSNMDVFERLKEEDLKRSAVMVATIAYHTAQLEHLLPRKNDVEFAD